MGGRLEEAVGPEIEHVQGAESLLVTHLQTTGLDAKGGSVPNTLAPCTAAIHNLPSCIPSLTGTALS